MTSRLLSFVALSGMLVAAGCSGGGSGSTSSLTPTTTTTAPTTGGSTSGGSGSSSSTQGVGFSLSFNIPGGTGSLGTTSTGRQTEYISPATTGMQVLLSANGAGGTFAVGTQSSPLVLNGAGAVNIPVTSGAYGTNAPTPAIQYTPGTAQLANAVTDNVNSTTTTFTVNTLPGSATIIPVANQPYTITSGGNIYNILVVSVTGTLASGLFITSKTPTATNTGNVFPVGSTITFASQSAAIAGSTFSYTVTPVTGNGSNANGYYAVTLTFNNMKPATNYVAGVVLVDASQPSFPILSEGLTGVITTAAFGTTAAVTPTLSLKPVVFGAYIPTPAIVTAVQAAASGAPAGSYESTIFATDARGFVIPSQGALAIDNAATLAISSTALTLSIFPGFAQQPNTTLVNTTPPATNTYGGGVAVGAQPIVIATANVLGTYFINQITPTNAQPLTVNLANGVTTNAVGVGTPLNMACSAASPNAGPTVVLNSTTPATVPGYTYTPGTNVPASGNTTLVSGGAAIPIINCNPSFSIPIN
jgi:hypothetical protein